MCIYIYLLFCLLAYILWKSQISTFLICGTGQSTAKLNIFSNVSNHPNPQESNPANHAISTWLLTLDSSILRNIVENHQSWHIENILDYPRHRGFRVSVSSRSFWPCCATPPIAPIGPHAATASSSVITSWVLRPWRGALGSFWKNHTKLVSFYGKMWENVANCVGMVIEARQIIACHRDL